MTRGMGIGGLEHAMRVQDLQQSIHLAVRTLSKNVRRPWPGHDLQVDADLARAIADALEELKRLTMGGEP